MINYSQNLNIDFFYLKLRFKLKETLKNKVKSFNFKVEEIKTLEITMIVKIMKYIKKYLVVFNVNICNNNELNFDVISKNNTYFAYLNFTMNCTQSILDFEATIYIYCKKTYFSELNSINTYIA